MKDKTKWLIFLCWLVYTVSYLGKVNYSANITQIMAFYHVSKSEAGMAPTFFFFAYGIGQVVNGLFCKRYPIKWMVFLSLMSSSLINLTIAVSNHFAIIKWLWLLNGLVLSVLWPTIIRFLSESLPKAYLAKSSIVMGTTVASGTLIIYLLSSIYAIFNHFKLAFYTASFTVMPVAVIWLILYDRVGSTKETGDDQGTVVPAEEPTKESANRCRKQATLLYLAVGVLCFFAVGVNLIKDGLTTWVPSILKEEFRMTDSLSIFLTLLLPIVAMFGNLFAVMLHKKISDYVTQSSVCFAAIGLFIGGILLGLSFKMAVAVLAGLVIVCFLASSLNSLVTSVFPVFMREKVNSGKIAGILNGFCYLGSTISSYGLGSIAEHWGWSRVFYVLIGVCLVFVAVWCGYTVIKKLFFSEIV